jgi:esterase/lipase
LTLIKEDKVVKVEITPKKAFVDAKLNIQVKELIPKSQLKVTLRMELPWCSGEIFSSYAVFIANDFGEINLDDTIPVEGSYHSADSMGLIYSLKLSESSGKNIALNITIENPMIMNFEFENESERKEIQIERVFKRDNLIVRNIDEEFTGQLFYQEEYANTTIVMLGGSDGQMESLSLIAGPLASRGFHVLTVSYFGTCGLPEKLEEVPLEYFEAIFKWIKDNEYIKTEEICLYGISKGGELALLLASRYKQISKVVAIEPHTYCFQALDGLMSGKNVSSWSYKGTSLPFIPVDNNMFWEDQKIDIEKGNSFGFASTYKKCIERATNKEAARIKIEHSDADLLLVCGEEDNIWNSYDACKEVMSVLKSFNYKHHAELLNYPHMGHPMPIPYVIPISYTLELPMNGGIFSSGGTVDGNAKAQYQSFQKTIQFLQK